MTNLVLCRKTLICPQGVCVEMAGRQAEMWKFGELEIWGSWKQWLKIWAGMR